MAQISENRLAKYRRLAEQKLLDVKDDAIRAYLHRAVAEGIDPIGVTHSPLNTFFRAPYARDASSLDIALVGVPMDMTVPLHPGTQLGPRELRKWSQSYAAIHNLWKTCPYDMCNIGDIGDVPMEGYSIALRVKQIRTVFEGLALQGVNTLTAGGEHTITLPILMAMGKKEPLGIVHLDAHGDTTGDFGGDEYNDGVIFRRAAVEGVIDPERTVQIGIRGRGSFLWDFSHESGMRVITAEEFQERGATDVMKEVRHIIGSGPTYLSIDSDSMDTSCMSGTSIPEPFGLAAREVRDIIRGLRGVDLVGADLAEINPLLDPVGASANLGAAIMLEMLCLLAEARVKRTGQKRKTHWQ
jgi:agmatinase